MHLCAFFVTIFYSAGQHKGMVVHGNGGLIGTSNFLSMMGAVKEIKVMHLPISNNI